MTLNGVMAVILSYFTEFSRAGGHVKLVEVRPILSVTKCSPILLKLGKMVYNWLCN